MVSLPDQIATAASAHSAGFQPAVSPISNRQADALSHGSEQPQALQAGSPATQQVGNLRYSGSGEMRVQDSAERACFHCGKPCETSRFVSDQKLFCCRGCLTVHDLLIGSGLGHFYDLGKHPGVLLPESSHQQEWGFLDQPELARRLV